MEDLIKIQQKLFSEFIAKDVDYTIFRTLNPKIFYCPRCKYELVIKKYKDVEIFACNNENCLAAFTINEIIGGDQIGKKM